MRPQAFFVLLLLLKLALGDYVLLPVTCDDYEGPHGECGRGHTHTTADNAWIIALVVIVVCLLCLIPCCMIAGDAYEKSEREKLAVMRVQLVPAKR